MKKYRKKPVVIEAAQWDGSLESIDAICRWANVKPNEDGEPNIDYVTNAGEPGEVLVHTLEGPLNVSRGDYVIKGVQGEFYPCKPDIFVATYEEAE